MTETKTIIKVFVASSLKHKAGRLKIKEVLEKPNNLSSSVIRVYLHEEDGSYSFRTGEDSQQKITAEAIDSNAFILYAGDYVGRHTIGEFLNILRKKDGQYTLIYVIHNPEERLTDYDPKIHIPWQEFYDTYMKDKELGVTYYEVESNKEKLETHLEKIRDELLSKSLLALRPSSLNYGQMLSSSQQLYRLEKDFYYPRPTDPQISDAISSASVPFILVAGESLAGKTRSIVHALSLLDPDTKIYFLRGSDTDAADRFMHLKKDVQFPEKSRNILFIDEIDRLLLNDSDSRLVSSEAPRKFSELCNLSLADGHRLTIIGSTNCRPEDLIGQMRKISDSHVWLEKSEIIEIEPMETNEMFQLARILRSRSLIDQDAYRSIKQGMPIGALFVDLTKLRSIYEGYLQECDEAEKAKRRRLFHSIKSLGLWKFSSRNDFYLLLDFFNFLGNPGEEMQENEFFRFLSGFKDFISVKSETVRPKGLRAKPVTTYSMMVDDVIRDSVLRFDTQEGALASDNDFKECALSILNFIITRHDENPDEQLFRPMTILFSRLNMMMSDRKLISELFDAVLEVFPVRDLLDEHEYTDTFSETFRKDWVDQWLAAWAKEMLERSSDNFAEIRQMVDLRPSAPLLAIALRHERMNNIPDSLGDLLYTDGRIKDEYALAETREMADELIARFPTFTDLLDWAENRDYDELTRRFFAKDSPLPKELAPYVRRILSLTVTSISSRISTKSHVEELSAMLDRLNEKRRRAGLSLIFTEPREKYFLIILPYSWNLISAQIASADLTTIFQRLNAIGYGEVEKGKINHFKTNKAMILNQLMRPMNKFDALECWENLGELRDSFSLRIVLGKVSDFAEGRALFDTFMSEQGEDKLRITMIIINSLLKLTKRFGEIEDVNACCHRYGLFRNGETSVLDINDAFTFGCIYGQTETSFAQILSIVRNHRDKFCLSEPRSALTLGRVIQKAPSFAIARKLLYTETGLKYFTPEEQELLQQSPFVVSVLIKKVIDKRDGSRARMLIRQLMEDWQKTGQFHAMLGDADANIVNEIIRNPYIFHYAGMLDFLETLRKEGIDHTGNEYYDRHLVTRYIKECMHSGRHDEAIKAANGLVLKYSRSKRKLLQRAVDVRANLGNGDIRKDLNIFAVEVFPFITDDGDWELREQTFLDFFKLFLKHRYIHSRTLRQVLETLGRLMNRSSDQAEISRLKAEVEEIVSEAIKSKSFLDHLSYFSLNQSLGKFGIDLLDLSPGYSVMEDVTHRMCKGVLNQSQAAAEVAKIAQRRGINIHLTQTFYDYAITSERVNGKNVNQLLKLVKDLPKGIVFSTQMFHTIMKGVKSLDDIYAIEDAYFDSYPDGKAPVIINRYLSLTSDEVTNAKTGIPKEEYDEMFMYALNYKDETDQIKPLASLDDSLVAALLTHSRSPFNVDQIIRYVNEGIMSLNQEGFYHLIGKCRTAEDYMKILPLMPDGEMRIDYIRSILYQLFNSRTRKVNWSLFNHFNDPATIEAWREIISEASPKEYEKMVDRLTYLQKMVYPGHKLYVFADKLLRKNAEN